MITMFRLFGIISLGGMGPAQQEVEARSERADVMIEHDYQTEMWFLFGLFVICAFAIRPLWQLWQRWGGPGMMPQHASIPSENG
jgi:hypothetical protein